MEIIPPRRAGPFVVRAAAGKTEENADSRAK
jgi:hypothetical protein